MKKRSIIKKYERDLFPASDCELDPFWNDLIDEHIIEKKNMNARNSSDTNRHSLRDKK